MTEEIGGLLSEVLERNFSTVQLKMLKLLVKETPLMNPKEHMKAINMVIDELLRKKNELVS
jgi:hypothetical protein